MEVKFRLSFDNPHEGVIYFWLIFLKYLIWLFKVHLKAHSSVHINESNFIWEKHFIDFKWSIWITNIYSPSCVVYCDTKFHRSEIISIMGQTYYQFSHPHSNSFSPTNSTADIRKNTILSHFFLPIRIFFFAFEKFWIFFPQNIFI